eukprot:COSAG02_NODE_14403_length_1276_cov_1.515718_1_plen_157_part_00
MRTCVNTCTCMRPGHILTWGTEVPLSTESNTRRCAPAGARRPGRLLTSIKALNDGGTVGPVQPRTEPPLRCERSSGWPPHARNGAARLRAVRRAISAGPAGLRAASERMANRGEAVCGSRSSRSLVSRHHFPSAMSVGVRILTGRCVLFTGDRHAR